jgi:serine/threonine-protein kinase RsbW
MTAAYPVMPAASSPSRWIRVFPGVPFQVGEARAFVSQVLAGCPARETLMTCVSELSTNAIEHTASGDGGFFTVEVLRPRDGVACVAVTDAGGQLPGEEPGVPGPGARGAFAEGGRGIALVAALTSRWGYCSGGPGSGLTVWAEATWPVAVRGLRVRADTWTKSTGGSRVATMRRDPPAGGGVA